MQLGNSIAAVITGGASGLGAAAAQTLAEAGVKVAILDLDETRGIPLATQIGGLFSRCDVTSEESVASALKEARAAHGPERILVNCAGIAVARRTARRDRETGQITPHDMESFAKVVDVNLNGTFRMITACAPEMMKLAPLTPDGERGVIINTASVAAHDGQVGQAAYAASKGGVASLTLPVARDLARDGIRVVAILPGLFDTPMFATLSEEVRAALAASVPFPSRLGKPSEFAMLVKHICENAMLNGACLRLDGAVRLDYRGG